MLLSSSAVSVSSGIELLFAVVWVDNGASDKVTAADDWLVIDAPVLSLGNVSSVEVVL